MVVRCAVLFGLLGLFQSTLGPLIPVLRDAHGLTDATAGLLVTGFFAGCLVSTAVGGALTDRWARGYLQFASAILMVAGIGGLALPAPWPVPLVAVAVAGLGFGGLVLIVNTTMASHSGKRGVTLVNLVNGVFGLGAAAGPTLISLTQGGGYIYVFAALAVAIVLTLPPRADAVAKVEGQPPLRPDVTLLLFCGLLFCYSALETGLASWEAVNLRAHGYSPAAASALTSLFWLGLAAGRLLVPAVTAAWSASRIITTSLVASFAGLALIGVSASAPVGFLLVGLLAGPIFPTTLAWIARTLPHPRRVNAMVIASAMLGNAALPAVIGYSMQASSALLLPALVAVPVVTCLAIVSVLSRRTLAGSRCAGSACAGRSR